MVDRRVTIDRGARREREGAAGDRHVGIRGDHVDVVGLHAQAVGDRDDGHRRGPGQDLGQLARALGVQVLDDHERHAGAAGNFPQELTDGLEPAGGGADANDRERSPVRWR